MVKPGTEQRWTFSKRDIAIGVILLSISIVANVGLNAMCLDQGRGAWNLADRLEYKLVIDAALMGIAVLGWRSNRSRPNTWLLAALLLYAVGDLLAPVALVPWSGLAYATGHVILIIVVLKLCGLHRWQVVLFAAVVASTLVFFVVCVGDKVDQPAAYLAYAMAVEMKFAICMGYRPYRPDATVFLLSDVVGFIRKALFNIEPFHVVALVIYYAAILLYALCMFYRTSKAEGAALADK